MTLRAFRLARGHFTVRSRLVRCSLVVVVRVCVCVSSASGAFEPPSDVTIGVCLSASGEAASTYLATRAAIEYARSLTNLDYSVIPATDILTQEVDCGATQEDARVAAAALLATSVIGIIGGQTQAQSDGIASAAIQAQKPFVAIHSVVPTLRSASVNETWTLRLSASDYSQAAGLWDLYAAYINPTLQENYPVVEQVLIHVVYSSDDPSSLAMLNELESHGRFLGVPLASKVDLTVAGHTVATAKTALAAISGVRAAASSNSSHTLWVLSSNAVLSELLAAASTDGLLNQFAWVLTEPAVLAISSTPASSALRTAAHGMLGLMRAKNYVANDRMFSPFAYTDLAGNEKNWTKWTLDTYGAEYAYPSIHTQSAFDSLGTFARGLTTLLAVASEGAVYERGDLILANLLNVSYVGASGPISFTPSGERKTVRFDYVQLLQSKAAPGYTIVGAWSPLTGANMFVRDPALFDGTLGGNGFIGEVYERVDLAYSSVGFSYSWNSIPVQAAPPPIRYGACVVVSKELDALLVLGGTASSNSLPYSDVWSFSFVQQQWLYHPVSGLRPDARFYSGCTISGDFVYVFGGLAATGIRGDLWKFQVSANTWIQVPLPTNLAGRAQRAQFGSVAYSGGLAIFGGKHRPTINAEMWTITPQESFDVKPFVYKPQSWVQPDRPPYSNDLTIQTLLGDLTAPVTAAALIAGREVVVIVGGYEMDTSMAFIFDNRTGEVSPMYCSGDNPGYRSLTEGVVFGTKLFVNHGWDQLLQVNHPDVWTLDLACPGATCGRWELHVTMADGRDSLPSTLYGESIVISGGWGAQAVHNDLSLFNTLTKHSQTVLHGDYYSAPARKFHSTCLIGNQLVVWGGLGDDQNARSETFVLRLDEQTWTNPAPNTPAPSPRYGHSAASIRLEMYAFGGMNENGVVFSDLCVYSLQTGNWDTYDENRFKPEVVAWPTARAFHTTVSANDRSIFVYGGQDAAGAFMTDLWFWDVSISRFVQVFASHEPADDAAFYAYEDITMPQVIDFKRVAPLIQSSAVFTDNMIYFLGGQDPGFNPSDNFYAYQLPASSTITAGSGTWYQLPKLPAARNQHMSTLLSGQIYLYGGLNYGAWAQVQH
jgi:hypothetical protein